jgi:hypothetical protein
MRRLILFTFLLVACSDAPTPATGDAGPDVGAPVDAATDAASLGDGAGPDGSSSGDAAVPVAWRPTPKDRFLYQLGNATPDTTVCSVPFTGGNCVKPTVWVLDLYAADGKTPNAAGAAAVHGVNGHAVCYVSGGSLENWRPDASSFPPSVLGKVLDGWPNEKWLDVAQTSVLEPLMRARAQKCKAAGFDAIDWDNVDGYANDNGVGITAPKQIAYNQLLAKIAHDLGLSVALKNDLDQIPALVGDFDFAVNEQCAEYNECAALDPFTKAGKAVVQIEYAGQTSAFCPAANTAGRSASKMVLALTPTPWSPCQ